MRTLSLPDMLNYIYEKNVKYDIQFRMEDAQREFGCYDDQEIVKTLEKLVKSCLVAPLEGVKSAYRMTDKGLSMVKGYALPEDDNQQSTKEKTNEESFLHRLRHSPYSLLLRKRLWSTSRRGQVLAIR